MITCPPHVTASRKRLLDIVKALREAQNNSHFVKDFTMRRFVNPCGTPACALGHYAWRNDLQSEFIISNSAPLGRTVFYTEGFGSHWRENESDHSVGLSDDRMLEYFGLSYSEVLELFDADGCLKAALPSEAADYIESFVARKWPQWRTEQ